MLEMPLERDQALHVLYELELKLSECTIAPKGTMFAIAAEEGEQVRRALQTVRMLSDGTMLLNERLQERVRDAIESEIDGLADSIADTVFEELERALLR